MTKVSRGADHVQRVGGLRSHSTYYTGYLESELGTSARLPTVVGLTVARLVARLPWYTDFEAGERDMEMNAPYSANIKRLIEK